MRRCRERAAPALNPRADAPCSMYRFPNPSKAECGALASVHSVAAQARSTIFPLRPAAAPPDAAPSGSRKLFVSVVDWSSAHPVAAREGIIGIGLSAVALGQKRPALSLAETA